MINRTYIKYWPAEYHSRSANDAALQLRAELNGDVSGVTGITIDTFEASYNIIGKYPEAWAPKTRETADQASLPAAAALRRRRDDGDLRRSISPTTGPLPGLVTVNHDPALDARYPRGIPNRITVTFADGRSSYAGRSSRAAMPEPDDRRGSGGSSDWSSNRARKAESGADAHALGPGSLTSVTDLLQLFD